MQSYDARGEKCMIKGGGKEAENENIYGGCNSCLSTIISEIWVHKRTFCGNAPGAIVCESLL